MKKEYAILDRFNERESYFEKWLFFQRIMTEINDKPENQQIKDEMKNKNLVEQSQIVGTFIMKHYQKEWFALADKRYNVLSLLAFDSKNNNINNN